MSAAPMASAQASYGYTPGGGSTISATPNPTPALGSNNNFASLFAQVLQQQMARKQQQQQMQDSMPVPQSFQTERPAMPMHVSAPEGYGGGEGGDAMTQELKRQQQRAAIIALQQQTQGAPMKYTPGGFNMDSHLEMDAAHMTPGQRQAFLPQGSHLAVPPTAGMSGGREWTDMDARNEAVASAPRYSMIRGI